MSHESCTSHVDHENRLTRSEDDIQDIFDMIAKNAEAISKANAKIDKVDGKLATVIAGVSLLGWVGSFLIQFLMK